MARENEKVIERLIKCINDKKVEVMDELFHDDAVMDWPQSGERPPDSSQATRWSR